jgi:DNA-binding transcriptional ArsR family regulator
MSLRKNGFPVSSRTIGFNILILMLLLLLVSVGFANGLSHTARLAILKYLAETKICISVDISDYLPLGRTTVSQHLKELRDSGLIHGEIDGLKINYCLCSKEIERFLEMFENFFDPFKNAEIICKY